ncbi:MAG: hypothetical protein EOP35_07440 [Rubrivivax sp.]|nr:MAG: hypothetical protein EOP35_07440 [Rubrivivax sp.]
MRKLLALVLVLSGCLAFIGQAFASTQAGYADCCLHGCKGMAQCASAVCQACAAPQAAPLPGQPPELASDGPLWPLAEATFDAGSRPQPWTPPD